LNVGEWIQKRALTRPGDIFLQDDDRTYNNIQFNERVHRTGNALLYAGIVKGDRVAILMGNGSEFLEIFFACARIGAILVPLNHRLAVPELSYILKDAEPSVLIYAADFDNRVQALKATDITIPRYFYYGEKGLPGDSAFADDVNRHPATESVVKSDVDLKDPLVIIYTAGTTGLPKGAVLTHENILFGAIHSLLGYGINRSYKSLVVAPLFHIGALAASVTPIVYAGGSLVISSFNNASKILAMICDEKINYLFAVPVMFQLMAETEKWQAADLSHVHFLISGGASIPLPMIRKYQKEKGVGFVQGYALTETGRLTSLDLDDSLRKAGSVGKEVFHVTLRIVDEQGKDLPPNEPGEIIVKGPNVCLGYWNNEALTRDAFRAGWFHTGDMGKRDEDGFLYIIGRKIEMIISSGENIYPVEVERAIEALPEVREAVVMGIPDTRRGEAVIAFVILHSGEQMNKHELLSTLRGEIAPYKIPRQVFFVDEFPRSPAGKVLRRDLKKRFETL